jgi:hypothetical protein
MPFCPQYAGFTFLQMRMFGVQDRLELSKGGGITRDSDEAICKASCNGMHRLILIPPGREDW